MLKYVRLVKKKMNKIVIRDNCVASSAYNIKVRFLGFSSLF